jgi:hypothetical protein
LAPVEHII